MKLSLELSLKNINEAVSGTFCGTITGTVSRKYQEAVSGTFCGTGCRPPCASLHKTSRPDGASRRRSPPGKPSPLPPRCWNPPSRPREKLVAPSVSTLAQKRWNHRPWSLAMDSGLGSASGGASTSIGSSSPRRNGAEGTTPLRASSPPPVVVTDTIRNPGASAAAPESLPSTRPLADLVTIYHYIDRLVLLTSQPERVFIQPARIAAGGIFHQFISTH